MHAMPRQTPKERDRYSPSVPMATISIVDSLSSLQDAGKGKRIIKDKFSFLRQNLLTHTITQHAPLLMCFQKNQLVFVSTNQDVKGLARPVGPSSGRPRTSNWDTDNEIDAGNHGTGILCVTINLTNSVVNQYTSRKDKCFYYKVSVANLNKANIVKLSSSLKLNLMSKGTSPKSNPTVGAQYPTEWNFLNIRLTDLQWLS